MSLFLFLLMLTLLLAQSWGSPQKFKISPPSRVLFVSSCPKCLLSFFFFLPQVLRTDVRQPPVACQCVKLVSYFFSFFPLVFLESLFLFFFFEPLSICVQMLTCVFFLYCILVAADFLFFFFLFCVCMDSMLIKLLPAVFLTGFVAFFFFLLSFFFLCIKERKRKQRHFSHVGIYKR